MLDDKNKLSGYDVGPTGFFGIGTTEPNSTLTVFEFKQSNETIIDIRQNGEIYIRGELVDNNHYVYEAMLDLLEDGGYIDNWKRNGN